LTLTWNVQVYIKEFIFILKYPSKTIRLSFIFGTQIKIFYIFRYISVPPLTAISNFMYSKSAKKDHKTNPHELYDEQIHLN